MDGTGGGGSSQGYANKEASDPVETGTAVTGVNDGTGGGGQNKEPMLCATGGMASGGAFGSAVLTEGTGTGSFCYYISFIIQAKKSDSVFECLTSVATYCSLQLSLFTLIIWLRLLTFGKSNWF